MTPTGKQSYKTLLFKQKETGGSVVYGNAVIRAFYLPKNVATEIGDPEEMYIELSPKSPAAEVTQ